MPTTTVTRSILTHPLFDVATIREWKKATKTKPIRVKHIQTLIADEQIAAKLLLQTIECDQMLKANSLVCVGGAGDVWQQSESALLKKYTLTGFDGNGYMIFTPKPDNEVDCWFSPEPIWMPSDGFSIKGLWGEHHADGSYIQYGELSDVICRSQSDPNDVWIVQRRLFDSTYDIKV